ncbi:MAG: rhomboid family intramembrane serine protease [Gammaproteobacteria bacterium]|nr:rhomboid family intramembrane serine protease [Gammaproteobacteria bacterium]
MARDETGTSIQKGNGHGRASLETRDTVIVATGVSEREYAELSLVLTARGIEHQRLVVPGGWAIAVAAEDRRSAGDEIASYRAEHAAAPAPPPPVARHPDAWYGVAAYAAVLMVFAILTEQAAFGVDWHAKGMLIARAVVDGEPWRVVTALTLHGDTLHLASNLAFGGFFGFFLGRYFGSGVAWLAILGSGAVGNLLNALVQQGEHRSIGASTAVFGALGLLTAHAWRRGPRHASLRARLAPIVAGIALLAFTGTGGENTDVFAHLTGFVAGFAAGAVLARVDVTRLPGVQPLSALATFGLLMLAWALALAF